MTPPRKCKVTGNDVEMEGDMVWARRTLADGKEGQCGYGKSTGVVFGSFVRHGGTGSPRSQTCQ